MDRTRSPARTPAPSSLPVDVGRSRRTLRRRRPRSGCYPERPRPRTMRKLRDRPRWGNLRLLVVLTPAFGLGAACGIDDATWELFCSAKDPCPPAVIGSSSSSSSSSSQGSSSAGSGGAGGAGGAASSSSASASSSSSSGMGGAGGDGGVCVPLTLADCKAGQCGSQPAGDGCGGPWDCKPSCLGGMWQPCVGGTCTCTDAFPLPSGDIAKSACEAKNPAWKPFYCGKSPNPDAPANCHPQAGIIPATGQQLWCCS